MSSDIEKVIHTPDKDLEPCPFCGGNVRLEQLTFDWGPYDLRESKFRCQDCGGLFEYIWRPSGYKHVPHAIEWFNTRRPAQVKEYQGYSVEELQAVVELLKEQEITPTALADLCHNMSKAIEIAKVKFAHDLHRHLQEITENNITPRATKEEV